MALVNQDLVLDVVPGPIPPILYLTEYDENMEVVVTLMRRGQPFQIPTETAVKIEGTLKGHPFSENGTPSGNTVTFMVSKNMTPCAGRAWVKIKLTKDSKPVHSCGFWMDVDRAGVEAETVIGAPGFEEQIADAVEDYLDDHQPFFTLPSGGQSGQALLSDGNGGAVWGQAQGGGTGLTDAIKTALLACFAKVAWIDQNGQTYYDALYNALYVEAPPTPLIPSEYQQVEYIGANGTQYILLKNVVSDFKTDSWEVEMVVQDNGQSANTAGGMFAYGEIIGYWFGLYGAVYTQNGASVATPTEGNVSWDSTGMTTVTSYATRSVNYSGAAPTHKNICLFGIPSANGLSANYCASAKLYSMSIRKGGNAFMNLIPCYRKSDSAIGLYDTIGEQFLENDGTGTFTKGADV